MQTNIDVGTLEKEDTSDDHYSIDFYAVGTEKELSG